jgi:thiol-disulfide isomerase/thioredoxin
MASLQLPWKEAMTTLRTLLFVAACLSAAVIQASEPVLVQFHSQQCGPCRSMQPVVQRLSGEGYPLQQVDVDQQPQLAQQHNVRSLPTFVMFDRSREVGRVEGPATFDQLATMVHATGFRPAGTAPQQVNQPALQQPVDSSAGRGLQHGLQPTQFVSTPGAGANPVATGRTLSPEQRAAWATVRLKVEDDRGYGFGTGTIIDTHDDEALVLTCGHLFRQSQGKGKITVDLFAPGATKSVDGQVVMYDLDRDVGLVSIRPNIKIEAVPVAPADYVAAPRDRIFTIGCDKGADPSLIPSHILQVNRYQGSPNITVAGMPVGGRSGGGLFAENGMLIGVCNAADEKGNEGLYAALASVHWQLDQIGQQAIYQRTPNMHASVAAAASTPPSMPATFEGPARTLAGQNAAPPLMPASMTGSPAGAMPASLPGAMSASSAGSMTAAPPGNLASSTPPAMPNSMPGMTASPARAVADHDTEVIVIVRSRSNPARQSEIFVMDRPSNEILQQLQMAGRPAAAGSSADLLKNVSRGLSQLEQANDFGRTDGSPIVRGQSQ